MVFCVFGIGNLGKTRGLSLKAQIEDLKPDNIMLNCKGEDQNRNIHDCYGVVIDLGTLCNKTICSTEKVTGTLVVGYIKKI